MAGGRPLKFKTVKELEEKIDKYFNDVPIEEWTITGLALALDTYRKVLCDYEDRDEYSYTIKKAKQMVEHSYEIDLKKSGRTGTIFALKNFDWKDKTEQDITSDGKAVSIAALIQQLDGTTKEQGVEDEPPLQDNGQESEVNPVQKEQGTATL